MTTTEKRYDLEKKIIAHIYKKSKDYSGDGKINYAYASGAFESVIYELIKRIPPSEFEKVERYLV